MIAVDTNLLVRILTNDDPNQAQLAAEIMKSDAVFIAKTVLLETEWVLRHAYGIDKQGVVNGFQRLMGLANIRFEKQSQVFQALSWFDAGLDFADALHLASSARAEAFATFDSAFARRARRVSTIRILQP